MTGSHQTSWLGYATCAWTALFGAPHVWWALGNSFAFPGGEASYRIFMSATWRIVFDWVVVLLSATGFGVALALVRPWGRTLPRWPLNAAAWTASAVLLVRGVAGLAVDGLTDLEDPSRPIWTVGFVVGGLLFGSLAWRAHQARSGDRGSQAAGGIVR
jgi:hypothetical protein